MPVEGTLSAITDISAGCRDVGFDVSETCGQIRAWLLRFDCEAIHLRDIENPCGLGEHQLRLFDIAFFLALRLPFFVMLWVPTSNRTSRTRAGQLLWCPLTVFDDQTALLALAHLGAEVLPLLEGRPGLMFELFVAGIDPKR